MTQFDNILKGHFDDEIEKLNKKGSDDIEFMSILSNTHVLISFALNFPEKIDNIITLSLESAREFIFDESKQLIKASIIQLDPDKKTLRITHQLDLSELTAKDFELKVGDGIAGIVWTQNVSMNVPNVQEDSLYIEDPNSDNIGSLLSVPIISPTLEGEGDVIGVLSFTCLETNHFDNQDLKRTTAFSDSISVLLRMKQMNLVERQPKTMD